MIPSWNILVHKLQYCFMYSNHYTIIKCSLLLMHVLTPPFPSTSRAIVISPWCHGIPGSRVAIATCRSSTLGAPQLPSPPCVRPVQAPQRPVVGWFVWSDWWFQRWTRFEALTHGRWKFQRVFCWPGWLNNRPVVDWWDRDRIELAFRGVWTPIRDRMMEISFTRYNVDAWLMLL